MLNFITQVVASLAFAFTVLATIASAAVSTSAEVAGPVPPLEGRAAVSPRFFHRSIPFSNPIYSSPLARRRTVLVTRFKDSSAGIRGLIHLAPTDTSLNVTKAPARRATMVSGTLASSAENYRVEVSRLRGAEDKVYFGEYVALRK